MIWLPPKREIALRRKQGGYLINPFRFVTSGGGGGSGPVWLSNTTYGASSSTTSHSIPMPATIAGGDLLLMYVNVGGISTESITISGWTMVGSKAVSGSGQKFQVLAYKVASGSEGGTNQTVSLSSSGKLSAITHQIQVGTFSSTNPVERAAPTISAENARTQPNSPSYSPSWGNKATLWFSIVSADTILGAPTITGAPLSDGASIARASGGGVSVPVVATCNQVITTATEDPSAWGLSIAPYENTAETIAVQPS